ncbi:golgi reassembly stacking protein-like protein [Pleomassaria siparia CBS 279.74]|uniref:Golgi reassembly stacking protein-like protein n=1 Tax=Pleomassaria siparia CBS 279.74 TaxID=1314801 RepID=A0A6G1K4B4_9PLEO|nr:golgi reassembly stacking protein-like protein [Pleomassaria siparia CBS 279.74]
MFGALNRFIARLDAGNEEPSQSSQAGFGFQVLRNTNPDVPLDPWFDFVIGINGRTIDNPDPNLFATEVRNCAGSTISLGVFSAKGQKIREIYVPIPAEKPTLGISLQWTPLSVTEDVWHILDVIPNSPADLAGLLPYGDYVIGSPEGLVRGESGLSELVEDYLNRPLRLIVYNHEYAVTRPITITPARGWGGEGALGCVLGFGALHRIPESLEDIVQGPGETLFSTDHASFDEKRPVSTSSNVPFVPPNTNVGAAPELFVPANMALPSKSPPPPMGAGTVGEVVARGPPKRGKARAHHAVSPMGGGGLDDYFKEGEQKSQEQDYAPAAKANVPPPPKAGPPRGPPQSVTPVPAEPTGEEE